MIATAVAIAYPPAGAVIAAAVVVYSIGKTIWGWLAGGGSAPDALDPAHEPPPTPHDMYRDGADLQWVAHEAGAQHVAVVMPKSGTKTRQTLLLDSKWTDYNEMMGSPLIDYSITPISGRDRFDGGLWNAAITLVTGFNVARIGFTAWQGGKKYPGRCAMLLIPSPAGEHSFDCGLDHRLSIGEGRPAAITIDYAYDLNCKIASLRAMRPARQWKRRRRSVSDHCERSRGADAGGLQLRDRRLVL